MSQQIEDTSKVELPEHLVPLEARPSLKEVFEPMKRDVELHIYTVAESQDVFSRFVRQLGRELCETSPRIAVLPHSGAEGLSDITALPQIVHQRQRLCRPRAAHGGRAPGGRRQGAGAGHNAGGAATKSGLSKGAKAELATLKEKRIIKVFGTGT